MIGARGRPALPALSGVEGVAALISISSIHLLKTFITVITPAASSSVNHEGVKWQVIIHLAFVLSAIALAWTDKLMMAGVKAQATDSH